MTIPSVAVRYYMAVLFLGNADYERADIIAVLLVVLHMASVTHRELQRHHSCTSYIGKGLLMSSTFFEE